MKQFLILAVVLCVVFCDDAPKRPSRHFRGNRKFLQICANQSGLSKSDVKTLREKSLYTLLTAQEQAFICCVADPLIYEGKIVMERLKKIVTKKAKGVPIDLEIIKNECEKTGAKADDLTSCPKTATFAQCVFVTIRNLVNDHKQSMKPIVNNATIVDKVPEPEANKDTVINSNAEKEPNLDTNTNTDVTANIDTNANVDENAKPDTNANVDENAKPDMSATDEVTSS